MQSGSPLASAAKMASSSVGHDSRLTEPETQFGGYRGAGAAQLLCAVGDAQLLCAVGGAQLLCAASRRALEERRQELRSRSRLDRSTIDRRGAVVSACMEKVL